MPEVQKIVVSAEGPNHRKSVVVERRGGFVTLKLCGRRPGASKDQVFSVWDFPIEQAAGIAQANDMLLVAQD